MTAGVHTPPAPMDEGTTFHMTYQRDRPGHLPEWIERHQVPIMTSAHTRWSDATDRFLRMWEYDTPRAVDSGGFNSQAHWGDFPWSVEDYHEWLSANREKFAWAAVMDYACESRFDDLWSYETRMEKTVENTIEHFNLDPEYRVIPVLQGRELGDYLWSYDQLQDHGIPTAAVGLGTVCRISRETKLVELVNDLRDQTDIEWIHGFGVKLDAFKSDAHFNSADSYAWIRSAKHGECYLNGGGTLRSVPMPDDSLTRTVRSFQHYYSHACEVLGQTPPPVATSAIIS